MKQTYDVPEKAVVMELEQLSLNDVQQTIEERQKKISDTIKKRAAENAHIAHCNLKKSKMKVWNNRVPFP